MVEWERGDVEPVILVNSMVERGQREEKQVMGFRQEERGLGFLC